MDGLETCTIVIDPLLICTDCIKVASEKYISTPPNNFGEGRVGRRQSAVQKCYTSTVYDLSPLTALDLEVKLWSHLPSEFRT
jgi:hypothetical protein